MQKEKYTIENITNILNKVNGIEVFKTEIKILKSATIGMKTLSKVDFLKRNGYTVIYVDSLNKIKDVKGNNEDFEEHRRKKKKKGIDVLSNVKSKMKLSNFKINKQL